MCSLLLSVTASRPSEQSGLGNIQIFLTLVVIHGHIYFSIYLYAYRNPYTPIPNTIRFILALPPSHLSFCSSRARALSTPSLPKEGGGGCCIVLGLKEGIFTDDGKGTPSREQHEQRLAGKAGLDDVEA